MTGKHDSGRIEKILHFGYILKAEIVSDRLHVQCERKSGVKYKSRIFILTAQGNKYGPNLKVN